MNTDLTLKASREIDGTQLFAPHTIDYFFKEIYGRQHFIFDGTPQRINHLLSWAQVNEILNTHRLIYPRLRLSRDGEVLHKNNYQKGAEVAVEKGGRPILRNADFHREVANGATVIIDYINEICRPIQKIAEAFEDVFQAKVQANAYLAHTSRNGFGTHWDSHDVLALQVAGRKYWRIYGTTVEHPLREDNHTYKNIPTEPIWEGYLTAGQILYLPRGCWHDARATGEESIHLSFGVHHKTGCDFVKWGLKKIKESPLLRQNLWRSLDKEELQAHQAKLVEEVVKCLSREDLYYEYLRDNDARILPHSYHLNLPYIVDANTSTLPPETKVRLARRKRYLTETLPNGYREIYVFEKKWKFPPDVFAIIETLMTEPYLTVTNIENQLAEHQYSKAEVHAFLLGLIRKGLLTLAQ